MTNFEGIREGPSYRDGQLTTRSAQGPVQGGGIASSETASSNTATGERYRWISEGQEGRTRSTDTATQSRAGRYEGISVTLYGKGEAVSVSRSASAGVRGGSVYLGTDILGSVRSATGEAGTLEGRYEYDAFGRPYKGDLDGGMNLGYTGKPYDSRTGLYNYGYRDYEPATARFTTADPVRDGSNWFAYVNNDPVNYTDPWGLNQKTVFDEFMDFIQQQGVERKDPTEPYKYEKIADSWDDLPTEVTGYLNIQNPISPIVQRLGNHEGNQLRLPGGYHIAEAKDENKKSGVYVHHDKIDPLRSPVDTLLHGLFEVKFAPNPGPKSTDDRKPDWCSGK